MPIQHSVGAFSVIVQPVVEPGSLSASSSGSKQPTIIRRELFLWDGKFLESGIDCERRETFFSVGKYFNGQKIIWSHGKLSLERKAMYWSWKCYEDDDIMF